MSIKNIVLFLGVVFLAIGILGFFTNPVIGLFEVDTLLNSIHVASGVIAIAMAMRGEEGARAFSRVFGVIYAVIGVVGLLYPGPTWLGLMSDNLADTVLHLVMAAAFLGLGYSTQARFTPTSLRYNH